MSAVIILLLFVALVWFLQRHFAIYRCGWRIPGPWAVPLLGNLQMIQKMKPQYLLEHIMQCREHFKRTFRFWLGPQLWVFLHSVDEAREALADNSLVKPTAFQQLNLLLGNGLLISEGQRWRLHRRMLAPAFQAKLLSNFVPVIRAHALTLMEKLSALESRSVDVDELLFPCILDIVIETSMGKRLDAQGDGGSTYTRAFHQTSEILFQRMANPILSFDCIFRHTGLCKKLQSSLAIIHELTNAVIEERAAGLCETSGPQSLLDTLMTSDVDGQTLSLQNIRDEVNTFLFAGVDTTAAAMSFILYALAKYPLEQAKLVEEFEQRTSLSFNEMNSLPHLDMFLKECLRYYTVVPLTGRQTTADTRIGNITYCKGVTIWVNLYGLAHDPELFVCPEEFRPSRFGVDAQSEHAAQFSGYMPFSSGPHTCIGRKYAIIILKCVTFEIVRNFEISLSNPHEKLVLGAQMVLKSLNGIKLIFKRRICK